MLHIILLILKIIGIILACIIGFVLLLLGLILFVAIKYKGTVDFEGKPLYKVKVWWIPGIVSVFVDNENGKNRIRVKVFGITVKDNGKETEPKEDKKSKKKKISDDQKKTDELTEIGVKASDKEVKTAPKAEEKTEKAEEKTEKAKSKAKKAKPKVQKAEKKAQKAKPKVQKAEKKAQKAKEKAEKKSLEEKIEDIKKKILDKLDAVSEKFKALKAKVDKIDELFFSPQGKKMVFKIKIALIKLVKHLLPTKLKGKLYLGMGDAYKTANTLTYIAAFYPLWSPAFEIVPDFQEKVMEGHVSFKGRIRLGYIVWLALVLIIDKHLRYTIKELKKLKG